MMRWRIFFWAGLGVLLASWGFCRDTQAGSALRSRYDESARPTRATSRQIHIIPAPSVSQAKSPRSASFRERIYQVKKGDTLAKIAGKTGVSVANLREVNRLKGSALKIGQKIELYRSQDSDAAETAQLVKNQEKSERAPEEEEDDGGSIGDGAGNVGERYERENAAPLGQWSNPEEQRMLVKVAMGFLGAPYRLGGSSVTGLDCSGFVKKIYQFFNIDLPRTAFAQSLVGLPVKRSELTAGDLLFFNTMTEAEPRRDLYRQ